MSTQINQESPSLKCKQKKIPVLSRYLSSVYGLSTIQTLSCIGGSYLLYPFIQNSNISNIGLAVSAGSSIFSLGSSIAFSYYTGKKADYKFQNDKNKYKRYKLLQKVAFIGTTIGMSGALTCIIPLIPTSVLVNTMVSTAVIGTVSSYYGYMRPLNSLSRWQGPLFCGALSSMGISISSLLFGTPLPTAYYYLDVMLISGFFAQSTNSIVDAYESFDIDVYRDAMSIYLNNMNMLASIFRITK